MTCKGPEARKSFWRGTHRTISPAETLERFGRHAAGLGITRLANVTGLDYLRVPVFMAVRPNSRSLSVSQGKGLDEASARVSAFMESAELAHAENIEWPRRTASYDSLRSQEAVADPRLLSRIAGNRFRAERKIPWIEGDELVGGGKIWVPFDCVNTDYTIPASFDCGFVRDSNGLASGNNRPEAICCGLYEVIERDAENLWRLRSGGARVAFRLLLASVTDPDCRALIDRLAMNDMKVAVWDITSDIGIASFLCRLREAPHNRRSAHGAFWGSGCHLNRGVALSRAITEAVQSRLTYIAGSRDDLLEENYGKLHDGTLFDLVQDLWEEQAGGRRFDDISSTDNAAFEDDLEEIFRRLAGVGLREVVAVDLTSERFEIPVLRIIVPGLEGSSEYRGIVLGRRARALARS